jgi:hypothetical protein
MCVCVGALLTLVCLCFVCWWYMHAACVPCLFACFVLLHLLRIYECVVAMHGEERKRERWEAGPAVVVTCELPQSAKGSERGCAMAAMVLGSADTPLSGIGRSEREGERGEERAGDADATEHDIN